MKLGLSLCLLITLAPAAQAATAIVNVGGGPLAFSPQTVTIHVGDTVTFVNKGGKHNARANDGSFRCANGCDATGGDGDPTTANWVASVIFTQAATIGYYCETHGAPGTGMFGTINVQGTTPVVLQSFGVD